MRLHTLYTQYTGHGHVVFIAGATAVVYSPIQHTQKFFNGHTEDVIALALHPDCVTAATGQVIHRPCTPKPSFLNPKP